jgi:hypothetical protein
MFETPILFIVFNRPETTMLVFEVIRQIKPKLLFIAADGPRPDKPEDIVKCRKTRDVVGKIDWDCEVKTLFREKNLGCGKGVSGAISWFFENVNEGIILEDDCVPHREFFYYCADLLKKYGDNPSILSIAGSNFQNGKKRGSASYYFSVHNRIWGWATWKRTWESYDITLNNIEDKESVHLVNSLFREKVEKAYWLKVFNLTKGGKIDTWDFQFMFLQWKLGGLTVTPNINLVSNIGYGDDATHTKWGKKNPNFTRPVGTIYPLIHPDKIERNRKADEFYFSKFIKPNYNLFFRINRKLKKILNITR